ncbi:glycogen debranching protein GlgX [Bifidobacterium callimiconis]|uniref:Glycogen debranching protein n=1 Tax=Bifidobacterium callimiconis TaxID=2306973 RepID=A0A430FCC6_9BIFI|nr:glycogen debranching protein GlgX [Bifidobacterium callimiconis]MBT1177443.1 glycogen debranching protein GlgX [Bifidobacterium callimiconis]RSX50496.1 glycogen debranching protein [Bifidobacterium callimiconis]
MEKTSLHRYATRPGMFLTDDGGADAVVWSDTADQVWLSVIESLDQPSDFYNVATELPKNSTMPFHEQIRQFPICSRILEKQYCRETLFRMEGPNYGMWYVHLPKARNGMRYGYRADGAWDPRRGVQFNPYKFLLDPYAKGIEGHVDIGPEIFPYECTVTNGHVDGAYDGPMSHLDSLGHMPYSVVIDDRDIHKHEGDPVHPHVPWSKTVIYELHVKGFTKNAPWMDEELRGTYAGLAHPTTVAYLQNLGITSVELLPIFAKQTEIGLAERGAVNYWGYSTLGYFAPEPSYATKEAQRKGPAAVRQEVIDMVRALHAGGIEVILDVVYNHTCEGALDGPSYSWRGLDAVSYYCRRGDNPGMLVDTTGCGNTLDFTNTRVINYAVDSLRYWSKRIGVDGFRFDLGASLARLEGSFSRHHPFLYALRSDLILGNLKMIMEPWDIGEGGWRTGQFGVPFAEWNDRFRDSTRRFWLTDVDSLSRGHGSAIGMQEMATRLCGSADLFATEPGRGAIASINFVSCHDGFTTTDLTRYATKHNEANGEDNRDGSGVNHSVNFGVEGPSTDPVIETKRERAAMNLLATVLMSLGTPMLLAGDEFRNTQYGNNNAYCQDSNIGWLDWDWLFSAKRTPQLKRLELTHDLIALRKSMDQYHHEEFFTRLSMLGLPKPSSHVQWFLPDGTTPMEHDWFNNAQRSFTMRLVSDEVPDVAIVVNGVDEETEFTLPADCEWRMMWSSGEVDDTSPIHLSEHDGVDEAFDQYSARARKASKEDNDIVTWTQTVPTEAIQRLVQQHNGPFDDDGDDETNAAAMPDRSDGSINERVKDSGRQSQHATANASNDGANVPTVSDEQEPQRENDPWLVTGLSISLFQQIGARANLG